MADSIGAGPQAGARPQELEPYGRLLRADEMCVGLFNALDEVQVSDV